MKAALFFLWLSLATCLPAATVGLSLEEATKIARQRAEADGLSADHLVIHLMNWLKDQPPYYWVDFEPRVPYPSAHEENVFVGYHIAMDGTVRRTTIKIDRRRVIAPFAPEVQPFAFKPSGGGLLDKPFDLRLDCTGRDAKATR